MFEVKQQFFKIFSLHQVVMDYSFDLAIGSVHCIQNHKIVSGLNKPIKIRMHAYRFILCVISAKMLAIKHWFSLSFLPNLNYLMSVKKVMTLILASLHLFFSIFCSSYVFNIFQYAMFLVCLADFFGGLLSLSAFSLLPPFVSSPLSNFLLLILVSLEIRFLHLIDLVVTFSHKRFF